MMHCAIYIYNRKAQS